MSHTPPDNIYLFFLPIQMEELGDTLTVHIPAADSWYWSLDIDGHERMSEDTVELLGLPQVHYEGWVHYAGSANDFYDLIARCHRAKGFDPYSTDAAIELGYPLVDVEWMKEIMEHEKVGTNDQNGADDTGNDGAQGQNVDEFEPLYSVFCM
ncbi:hypothetical protein C8R44DRAFT_872267 [Mycena epipterygia]|nr:hypothetical protein C8R44DRAFT_872267 [Mycena epipterygia]